MRLFRLMRRRAAVAPATRSDESAPLHEVDRRRVLRLGGMAAAGAAGAVIAGAANAPAADASAGSNFVIGVSTNDAGSSSTSLNSSAGGVSGVTLHVTNANATGGVGIIGTGGGTGTGIAGAGGSNNGVGVSGVGAGNAVGVFGVGGAAGGTGVLGNGGAAGDGVQGYAGRNGESLGVAGFGNRDESGAGTGGVAGYGGAGIAGQSAGYGVQGVGGDSDVAGGFLHGRGAGVVALGGQNGAGVVATGRSAPGVIAYGSGFFNPGPLGASQIGAGVVAMAGPAGPGVIAQSLVASSTQPAILAQSLSAGAAIVASTTAVATNAAVEATSGTPDLAAVLANAAPNGYALSVRGKAKFTRSGVLTIVNSDNALTVPVPGRLTSTSRVLATLQTYSGTLMVQAAVPITSGPDANKIHIYLTGTAPPSPGVKVAWFVAD